MVYIFLADFFFPDYKTRILVASKRMEKKTYNFGHDCESFLSFQ